MSIEEGAEKLARALLLPINPAAIILLGGYTIVWGLWLVNPFWNVFAQAQLYSVLAAVAPEWAWGSLAILCGAVTSYGAIRRRYRPLVRGSAVAGWYWFMIAVFYFFGDIMNTGGITALLLAIYSAFIYLNIRVNFKNDKNNRHILQE